MQLVTIAPGFSLASPHAATWRDMLAAGMPNRPQDINSASRTTAEQVRLYARYLADKATGRKPPRMAARPGTSNHEFPPDCAIDVQTGSPTWDWLVVNGRRFGVHRPIASEPWHFEFGARPAPPLPPPPAARPASAPTSTENDMRAIGFIYDSGPNTHPDYASTGVLWPWGFEQTSQGGGSRAAYQSAKAMADASGLPWAELHGDQNLLALHRSHGR